MFLFLASLETSDSISVWCSSGVLICCEKRKTKPETESARERRTRPWVLGEAYPAALPLLAFPAVVEFGVLEVGSLEHVLGDLIGRDVFALENPAVHQIACGGRRKRVRKLLASGSS